MSNSIRSELFFLRQYGFSNKLLDYIYLSGFDILPTIFNDFDNISERFVTKNDVSLAKNINRYYKFKVSLFENEPFLKKNSNNKIFFKYDDTIFNDLIPYDIRPLFMYAKGNYKILNNNSRVSIVGTRTPKQKSILTTRKIVSKYVNKNYIVVSGLAEGIDTVAHSETIAQKGKTIAILPTNFNKIYPKQNRNLALEIENSGLLLSSIGPRERTYKSSFLERNKYIANISDIIIVVETNLKSGTMNTIKNAYEAHKKILFVDQLDEEINKKIKGYNGEMING